MRSLLVLLPALLLAGSAPALEPLAEFKTEIRLEKKGDGFTKKAKNFVGDAKVKSFTVVADWWNGAEDDRVGDPKKAEKEFTFEVKIDRQWHALPPVTRDLRLEARVKPPADLFKGEKVRGVWSVRQKEGAEPVRRIAIEITYTAPWGKGLRQPDLEVSAIVFDELESHPPAEGHYPLKRDFPELEAGKTYDARVHIENTGYGDARKPVVSLFLTDLNGKGRKRLPPIEVGIVIREGEDLGAKWKLPVPKKLSPGLYLLHAVADPKDDAHELNEENNEFTRIVRVK